ncbi:MAG TPA: RnfABCDGE type electron transport complex subunit B [Eubacteriales bacterium]|nr:RnfABCDGE type electron transport complex subunit B [Clostridia bacterium]HRV72388.1 RnfABCDGE type electron transport complex subunit B [Eubacteriales bacterium]
MDFLPIVYAVAILGGLGVIFGLLLGFVGKKFEVKVDERVTRVRACLGGANCGACGFPGCDGFAQAVVDGKAPVTGCTAGGKKTADAIGDIMGVKAEVGERLVARVRCNGTLDNVSSRYDYAGVKSCRVAAQLAGGSKACSFACLGFGDCVHVCKFDSIHVVNGVAVANDDTCTGCGACVEQCPRSIIALIPKNRTIVVKCRNIEVGKIARAQCKSACIGCKMCERTCPSDAVHVVNGVAEIDPAKCTRCGACVVKCPTKCIFNFFEGLQESYDWE